MRLCAFDISIIGSIVCGLIMVSGGIMLLYTGAISLSIASKDENLTLEIFEKQFRLATRAPALGLFIIGLLFIGISIYFSKETAVKPIEVKGKMGNIQDNVTVKVTSSWVVPTQSGEVLAVLRPNLDVLWVQVSAPGYEPIGIPFDLKKHDDINFGMVELKQIIQSIDAKPENIVELPKGISSPPLGDADESLFGGTL
jgi:hypothetical protein